MVNHRSLVRSTAKGKTMAGGGVEFNGAKFKELVLLLAERSTEDPLMSRVKLNKLLYRCDFEAFRLLGQPMTGARYVKGEFGPMAAEIPLAEVQLGERGYLTWQSDASGPYDRKVPVAVEGADTAQFTDAELAIVADALAELGGFGGKTASEWSHEESAGWRAKALNETIHYETGLIDPTPADDEAVAFLRKLEGIAS